MLIDIDTDYAGNYEQWTVTVRDETGNVIDTQVVDRPDTDNDCERDPGDSAGAFWSFSHPTADIWSILISFTGTVDPQFVGVAFDNFSTSSVSADLGLVKSGPVDPVTPGSSLMYQILVSNNGPGDATGVTVEDPIPPGFSS